MRLGGCSGSTIALTLFAPVLIGKLSFLFFSWILYIIQHPTQDVRLSRDSLIHPVPFFCFFSLTPGLFLQPQRFFHRDFVKSLTRAYVSTRILLDYPVCLPRPCCYLGKSRRTIRLYTTNFLQGSCILSSWACEKFNNLATSRAREKFNKVRAC